MTQQRQAGKAVKSKPAVDMTTPKGRRQAWWRSFWGDHAFLRLVWTNLEEIAPGVWRSNQPSARRLESWIARLGLKTVFNLRGTPDTGFYHFGREVTEKLGITRIDMALSARSAPQRAQLIELLDVLERMEKPALFHCKSGADRTGLVAALYLLAIEGRPLAEALRQLSLRYVHLSRTKTGIMDEILLLYGQEARGRGFRQWLEEDYDPEKLRESFRARVGEPWF